MIHNRKGLLKFLPILLITLGTGILFFVLRSDLFSLGEDPGPGIWSLLQAFIGLLTVGTGTFLILPVGKSAVQIWTKFTENERPVSALQLAIWFGLSTGFLEVAILTGRKMLFSGVVSGNPNYFWMIPLGDVLVLLIPGLALFLVSSRLVTRYQQSISVSLFLFFCLFSTLFLFPKIYLLGSLLFSLGVAVQITRVVMKAPHYFYRLIRITTPFLIVMWVVVWILSIVLL